MSDSKKKAVKGGSKRSLHDAGRPKLHPPTWVLRYWYAAIIGAITAILMTTPVWIIYGAGWLIDRCTN